MESVYYYRQGNMQMPGGQGRGGPMPQPPQYMQNQSPAYRNNQENIRKRSHKSSKQNVPQPQEDRDEPLGVINNNNNNNQPYRYISKNY
ncbi:unnamed protein product [Cunninghamella echinulata]